MPQQTEATALGKLEVAERLNVSPTTVDRLIARGELRAKRIGRRVVVPESELVRYLAE